MDRRHRCRLRHLVQKNSVPQLMRQDVEYIRADIHRAEVERLQSECEAQARLVGTGAERELALMAKVERLTKIVDAAKDLRNAVYWVYLLEADAFNAALKEQSDE